MDTYCIALSASTCDAEAIDRLKQHRTVPTRNDERGSLFPDAAAAAALAIRLRTGSAGQVLVSAFRVGCGRSGR